MELNLNKVTGFHLLKILNSPGMRIHTSQLGEDAVLWHIFKNKSKGFYVDVGSHDPTIYSNTFLLHEMREWSGINIDADQRAIDRFNEVRPKDTNICAAVSNTESEVKLYLYEDNVRGVNTIVENMLAVQKRSKRIPSNELVVKTQTLENLLDKNLPNGQLIEILNIDCEGNDLNVLMSNNWDKYQPEVICIEDHVMDFNCLSENSIYQYLQSKGYYSTFQVSEVHQLPRLAFSSSNFDLYCTS